MNYRGLTKVPKNGEKQLYSQRIEWRWYQKYLPEDLKINASNQPQEEWWNHGSEMIHLDRYFHKSPKAKMIILHGGGGNGRVLSPFAIMSQKFGCEVVAPDLPGYGLTVRTRKTKPTYEKWSIIVSDLINQEIEKDGLPVFVWGLSLGGFLAYMVAARNKKVSGLIATTLADTRKLSTMLKVSKNPILGLGGVLLTRIFGPLIDPIKLPIKWLSPMALISNDPDVSNIFMKDKLAGGSLVRMGFLRSLMNAKPLIEPEEFKQCPVLLVHPEIDPWTPLDLSMKFFDKIPASKSVVVLEGCGHFPIDFPGKTKLEKSIESFVLSNVNEDH